MTVGGMGFIPERLLMMMMMMILHNTADAAINTARSFFFCGRKEAERHETTADDVWNVITLTYGM